MATDPEGIRDGRFNGMETIDKEIFQHLVLNTEEEAKMVVKAVESAGRVRGQFKVARQVLQESLGENHADPKGVCVPSQAECWKFWKDYENQIRHLAQENTASFPLFFKITFSSFFIF